MPIDRALAIGGIVLAILLVVLDKAGKLKGPVLLLLLAFTALMTLPLVLGNSWISEAPSVALKFTRGTLLFFLVGLTYSALAIWISGSNTREAFLTRANSLIGPVATPEAPSSIAPAIGAPSPNPPSKKLEPPITKTNRFATLVPILSSQTNVPVPMNTNYDDPHSEFYSDLLGMTGRPEKRPDGWPPYRDRTLQADNGSAFAVRLIQFYILKSVYLLHRGTSGGIRMTVGKGVTPIERLPIPPPDSTPYPNEQLLHLVSDNEFFRPSDAMIWKFDNNRLQVPKGTHVSLPEQGTNPAEGKPLISSVRFERPGYYSLDFDVSSGAGANNGLPAGFQPETIPGVTTWTVTITMHYAIQRRNDDNFDPQSYTNWADALFEGLRKKMGF